MKHMVGNNCKNTGDEVLKGEVKSGKRGRKMNGSGKRY